MCGLAGIYAPSGPAAPRQLLLEMVGELRHRGPDGVGLYLDGSFGMAAARLAVIDLEAGDQPLASDDGRVWAMQNGEIYNHVELQRELAGLGRRFVTSCDTEVVANAFAEWGPACLERLNGDFALAVWDARGRELFLARDRFGARPLFLADVGGGLAFASEIKALLRHPDLPRALDPAGIAESLVLWSISPERSAFQGVRELAPAHWLRLRADGGRELRRWWDLDFGRGCEREERDLDALAEELAFLLDDAVRLRLRADVPVAAYLSGGLDSSAIAALAARQAPGGLRAFAVGFADGQFDEGVHQQGIARRLGVELERVTVSLGDIGALFPRAIELAEQPSLRTALAPMLRLSAAAHEAGLKVVLTGEGADELFAGYDIFREAKIRRFWARDPQSRLRPALLRRLHRYLPRDLARAGAFGERFFARGLTDTGDPLYSHRLRFANGLRLLRLLDSEAVASALDGAAPVDALERRLPVGLAAFTPLGRAQYIEIHTFFQGYLLHAQGDRMLMGSSVEGRYPYLDHRIAELAASLGDSARLRGLREKEILRKATAPLLSDEIARRDKHPYRAPILRAFVGAGAPEYAAELLHPKRLAETGVLAPETVVRLVRKCEQAADRGVAETDEMALAAVLSVQLLHQRLVARPSLAPPAVPAKVVIGPCARTAAVA